MSNYPISDLTPAELRKYLDNVHERKMETIRSCVSWIMGGLMVIAFVLTVGAWVYHAISDNARLTDLANQRIVECVATGKASALECALTINGSIGNETRGVR